MTMKPCLNTSGRSKVVPESTVLSHCTSKDFKGVTHQKCHEWDKILEEVTSDTKRDVWNAKNLQELPRV